MKILLDLLTPINIIFIGIIIYLSYEDFRSFRSENYKNYKSIIFSIGILGTFTGIFWGLLNFDSHTLSSIQTSIPSLLNGLRTAFVTSIVAMFATLVLTFVQKKLFGTSFSEDSSEILRSIEMKLSKLDDVRGLYDVGLDLLTEVNSLKDDISNSNEKVMESISSNLENTNRILESSMEKLSEGSTREIVSALENVIVKFNDDMTRQFGENFKELNVAMGRLIEWQEHYKDTLDIMKDNLAKAAESIKNSDSALNNIASKNEEIIKIYEMFGEMTKQFEEQAYQINTRILTQVELLDVIQNVFNETKMKIGQFADEFSQSSNKVLSGFGETKVSMDKISMQMNASLSKQAMALNELSERLDNELPKSLSMLDKSLSALTEGFKNDYKTFLEYYKQLVVSQE